MIRTERVTINGREFDHTWSDKHTIMRDGVEYDEAYDPAGSGRVYVETDSPRGEEITGEEFMDMVQEVL